MSNEELARSQAAMAKLREELVASPEKARAFLVEAGIVTPDGKLTEPYRRHA
jgi:hypothetical protein